MPLTVGGGLRTVEDIVAALRVGADKVAINTAAIARPAFIKEAAETFGSQCIVLSVEAKKRGDAKWEALTDNGRETTGVDVLDWVAEAEQLGVGEVLVTSVDREGTRKGFDLDLLAAVRRTVSVPVIASGGAGGPEHLVAVLTGASADGIACASVLHDDDYDVPGLKDPIGLAGFEVRQ